MEDLSASSQGPPIPGARRTGEEAGIDSPTTALTADDAVREMVRDHGPAVYRLAASIVRDASLAEDVAQETFIRAWQRRDSYRGDAPVRHWLLRIAHNVAVSTLRTIREEAHDPRTLPDSAGPAVESVVTDRMLIDDALSRLDPLSRSIVVLREMESLSYVEIADVLDVALPTVKTRLFRARAQLRAATGLDREEGA